VSDSFSARPGCLGALGQALAEVFGGTKTSTHMPYRLTRRFLTPAELAFYHALQGVAIGRAQVCAKVRLADLLEVSGTGQYYRHFNRISAKHLDFVLCQPETMYPLVAVELDDRSHGRADRRERDDFVDRACAAAGLSLVRFPVRSSYDRGELEGRLAAYIGPFSPDAARVGQVLAAAGQTSVLEQLLAPTEQPVAASPVIRSATAATPASEAGAVPYCPRCGEPMVPRTVSHGTRRGTRFWGCPRYPACPGMRPWRSGE
jgi:hypothetical protein